MDFNKHAWILAVVRNLSERRCTCGKTNIQKVLAILNELVCKTPFEFVLYKHGPYSFDVQAEMEQMQTYRALESEPNIDGYGVTISEGPGSRFIDVDLGEIDESAKREIGKVCEFVCGKPVVELERLATAAWIRKRHRIDDSDQIAKKLHEIKPHVSIQDAQKACETLRDAEFYARTS